MHFKRSLPLLAASLWTASTTSATIRHRATNNGTSYDYIVVGSGPGGGPLAARLAIAGFKILLIDAGSDQGSSYEESVPQLWPLAANYEPMQWNYFVDHYANESLAAQDSKFTYQTPSGDYFSAAANNGAAPPPGSTPLGVIYPRAGTLGGCAGHNALITILPHDNDFANIESITGDSSWAPRKMKKYFEKLEHNEYLTSKNARGHGYDGWLGISTLPENLIVADSKITNLVTAGYAAKNQKKIGSVPKTTSSLEKLLQKDVNAPGQNSKEGLYQIPLAVSNGTRSSPRNFILETANALRPDGTKKYSLDVWLNTYVTKIRFDQSGSAPKALGVDFLGGINLFGASPKNATGPVTGSGSVDATREVIISAGAYNTPQILKLSGVGPKDELAKFNIPLVLDLPGVGANLQDRYETAVVSKLPSTFEILKGCSLLTTNPDPCLEQWKNGATAAEKGFYVGNAFQIGIVKKSSVAVDDPDLFIFGGPVAFSGFYPGWADLDNLIPNAATTGWWSWVVLKGHNRNTAGTVTLRSADPRDTPIITFNSFDTGTTTNGADQLDLQAFYEGVQFARQANKDLLSLDPTYQEVFPGPNITAEADVKEFIKKEAFGHHASCSCKIGKDGDPLAVLDSHFRVRGVEGLRVVDASAWPSTPGFFPALPTYIMSEKAADTIIQDAAAGNA